VGVACLTEGEANYVLGYHAEKRPERDVGSSVRPSNRGDMKNVIPSLLAVFLVSTCCVAYNQNHRQSTRAQQTGSENPEDFRKDETFDFSRLRKAKVWYCITDLNLLQEGLKAYDKDNIDYLIMKKCVEEQMMKRRFRWSLVDSNLTRRITLGLKQSANKLCSSLPYAASEYASSQQIEYLVIFYGYSRLSKKGAVPADIAASLAISSAGVLLGAITGFYFIAIPSGGSTTTAMDIYCAIVEPKTNLSVLGVKQSLTRYNDQDLPTQITDMYDELFDKIEKAIRTK
jgi:hypothetical protein